MQLTDLRELKEVLEIDPLNTTEDTKLLFFIEQATSWIKELLNRHGLEYKSRTEYYRGTGTQKLLLKSRPVFTTPTIQVFVDEQGYFGAASGAFGSTTAWTYGVDFTIQPDQEDGTSRSGILYAINRYWPKPSARQRGLLTPFLSPDLGSIKIIYTAGWTTDNMPAIVRQACNLLVSKMRYIFPLGMELSSESYEDRSISILGERKDYLLGGIKPMLIPYFRNWTAGGPN